jgi:methylmalonyl-CoA/ethylmalonyl-CoA epimerase
VVNPHEQTTNLWKGVGLISSIFVNFQSVFIHNKEQTGMISKILKSTRAAILSGIILFTTAIACTAQPSLLDIGRLEQVALTVTDIPRAEQFYERQLGLSKLFAQDNLLIFDLGGVRLLLGKQESGNANAASSSTLYLRCADLKLCMATLQAQQVHFDPEPEFVARQAANDLWIVFFRDPDGNSLALMSEAPRFYNPVTGESRQERQ